VKEECLNRIVPLGERHLRKTLHEFATHYHRERTHQGLGNELIDFPAAQPPTGAIRRRQRAGGFSVTTTGQPRRVMSNPSVGITGSAPAQRVRVKFLLDEQPSANGGFGFEPIVVARGSFVHVEMCQCIAVDNLRIPQHFQRMLQFVPD
jgi:hypothetical protein